MSPQSKAAPAAPETPAVAQKGEHSPLVHGLLEDAQKLSDELRGEGGLHERIGANRDTLRMIAKTGFLSTEQASAVREFYPERVVKKTPEAPAAA